MIAEIRNISNAGRAAAAKQDWATVHACANEILSRVADNPEGLFLLGLVEKAAQRPKRATAAFEKVLRLNPRRYDAAVELASQYSMARRNGDVADLLGRYEDMLGNSPRYLDMAGTVYTEIGLPEKAWPLYQRANELQPDITLFQGNLAACAVFVGEIELAKKTYRALLERAPQHQRNHYQLARLARAQDSEHIEQMEEVLRKTGLPAHRNIYLYYALAKEYEDLEQWEQSFHYYKRAGDAATSVANYNVESDIAIIDKAIEVCNEAWLNDRGPPLPVPQTPLFIVGLPRSGTTLTERIIASHSGVASVGETEFVQMVMRRESGVASVEKMSPEILDAAAKQDISVLRSGYINMVSYRLGNEKLFIDKLPFNVHYLGFIAKAWPETPIVLLRRNPMDSCFSMYKQVFTWAYKFSYDLDSLASYYIAYDRLCKHWRRLLGDRLIVVDYEELVSDLDVQARNLLDRIGLDFEPACLDFHKNKAPTSTASSVQVREKIHTRSMYKWKRFAEQLKPLQDKLESAGIATG